MRVRFRASLREGDLTRWGPHALAFFFGWGAVLVAGSCLLPGRTAPGFALAAAGVAGIAAILLLASASRVSVVALNVMLALGSVLIALVVFSSGRATSPDALLFVWVALFGGFFVGVRALAVQVVFVAIVYAVVLTGLPHVSGRTGDAAAQNLLLVVGAVAVAGAWVAFLRALIDSLLARLRKVARTDELTGLPNRAELLRRGDEALKRRARHGGDVAILTIDFDDFTLVNDRLGHAAGDRLLRAAGQRLTTAVREVDVVARLGGDKFAVLLESAEPVAGVEAGAHRIVRALCAPFDLGNETARVEASVGVAFATDHESLDGLLRDAELAMHAAKNPGGGWVRFCENMHTQASAQRERARDLRVAVEKEQLSLRFQPIVTVQTQSLLAVEALVRWEHPEHGSIGPDQFIPVAETTGLIVPLGRWVLREACAHASQWKSTTTASPIVSVNLSPRQLLDPDLVDDVSRALTDHNLPATRLMLEVTETSIMADPEAATARLDELRALGVALAIDDFGTGHSSLAYLRRLPVSDLKLARPFVRDLEDSTTNVALARGIIDLAHSLGMRVIAEGIENTAQLERLRGMSCDLAQGFLFDRPLLPTDLQDRLRIEPPPTTQSAATPPPDAEALAVAAHRALLAALPDHAFIVFDRELRFAAMEGEALERAGWRVDNLLGRRPSDVLPADRATHFESLLAAALDGRPQELRWPSVRGPHVFAITLTPLYHHDGHGGAAGVIALLRETETIPDRELPLPGLAHAPLAGPGRAPTSRQRAQALAGDGRSG